MGKAKSWKRVLFDHQHHERSLCNLVDIMLEGVTESKFGGLQELEDRKIALCNGSGSAGILPRVLL